ncbi:hypothetical protein [Pseudomonas sp.]|uniref:MrpH family fimbial adhesin n=1 Tax=Pseudomonas sp. TaxID=306 RepID=UPI003BAECC0E
MITLKKPYATALRSALASVLLCGAVMQVQAITITTTESHYEPGGVRYYFDVTGWTMEDGGKNPCATDDMRFYNCLVGLAANQGTVYYTPAGYYHAQWMIPVSRGGDSTMGTLLWALSGKGLKIPLRGSILVPTQAARNDLCITFYYGKNGPNIGGGIGLFGPCTRVATPALQCEIKGNATINHKNLPDNALDGVKASTQLNVVCRGPASVTVSTSETNSYGVRLRDDDSLYSKITVNGKDATAGIDVPVTDGLATPLNITSTLSTRSTVTPGKFSGFTVVTVSPP